MTQIKRISIVIPAKDEANRLPKFLEDISLYCKKSVYDYEVIVVDDGSQDNTAEECLKFQDQFKIFRVLTNDKNYGKGYAVRRGFSSSHGDVVLFLDADGATPPEEIERKLHYLKEGYDIVIGSRELTDDGSTRQVKWYRRIIGRSFHYIVKILLKIPFVDTQCGFKMFTRTAARDLFPNLSIDGFSFDIEILALALKKGFKIKEAPVSWCHKPGSRVNFFWHPLKMLFEIISIFLR